MLLSFETDRFPISCHLCLPGYCRHTELKPRALVWPPSTPRSNYMDTKATTYSDAPTEIALAGNIITGDQSDNY